MSSGYDDQNVLYSVATTTEMFDLLYYAWRKFFEKRTNCCGETYCRIGWIFKTDFPSTTLS